VHPFRKEPMSNPLKLQETSEQKSTNLPSSSKTTQTGPVTHRKRFNLVLAITALLTSLALVALGLFLFLGGDKATQTSIQSTAPAAGRTPSSARDEVYPTPDFTGFGFKTDAGPTPTAIPVTNEAARLRKLADEYYQEGRPLEAAAQYRLVLDRFGSSPEASWALFGLARSSVQRGRYAEAADNFKKFLTTYPNDPLRRYSYFYLGLVNKNLGQWDEALTYFKKYQDEQPGKMPLDGYASYEIAETYANTLKTNQSFDTYKKVADSNVTNLTRVTAMEKVGDDYSKANDPANAANWYGRVLEIAKVPEYRATLMSKQARALEAAGQTANATALYRQILDELVDTPAGFNTLKTLYNNKSPFLTDYFKGLYLFKAGVPDQAVAALSSFLGRPDENAAQPATPPNLSGGGQERFVRAWFLLANSLENKGDPPRAANEYRDLLSRFPQSKTAPEALFRLARLVEKANGADEALKVYGQLVQNYPADTLAEDGLVNQIRLAQTKGPEVAQPYADLLAQKYPANNNRSRVFYELGKAYQLKNDASAAREAFQKASEAPTVDFYTVRAGERIKNAYDPNQPPSSNPSSHPAVYSPNTFTADMERDRTAIESWLPTWAKLTTAAGTTPGTTAASQAAPNPLQVARTNLRDDPGLRRLVDLRIVGLDDWASREAKELVDRYYDSPLELYYVALNLSEQGEYYYSVTAAKRLLALYQQKNPTVGFLQVPLLLQKLIFPLPYQTIILEQSRRQGFDPLLMISLVKQESSFDQDATSSAGALGLTQVMPETGKGIATALDKPVFQTKDLYRPYTALEFGAFYLGNQITSFGGNAYQALGAYNGGAGNVYRWNKEASSAKNFDGWVENIDFPETRGYIQIIYANYYLYRQIYAAKR
jgi:soluble lytic murein transglycosylase